MAIAIGRVRLSRLRTTALSCASIEGSGGGGGGGPTFEPRLEALPGTGTRVFARECTDHIPSWRWIHITIEVDEYNLYKCRLIYFKTGKNS